MVRYSNNRLKERYDGRRLNILRAAARVFRARGLAASGMRDIAEAAELSPANLYHYFRGKHQILFFCQNNSLDRMLETLRRAALARQPRSEKLRIVIEAHLRCILDEVEGSVAHLEIDGLPAQMKAKLLAKRDRYEQGISRLVAAGMRSGEFAECDPRLVTKAILGSVNWTARWFRPDGSRSAAEVAQFFAEYLVRGLLRIDD